MVILFHAIYILFLKFAIWLPASSFWQMQDTYTQVLGREFFYIIESSVFLWGSILLPIRVISPTSEKKARYMFLASLVIFSLLNMLWLNPNKAHEDSQLIIPLLIYCFFSIFSPVLRNIITKIEKTESLGDANRQLLKFHLPQTVANRNGNIFKYHHILFCSSIVFFIASKTMAAKFISIGFLTINVGGIVFSLAYLAADMMTDVYGIERTKQMVLFVIFCNLLFVFDVWITNLLAMGGDGSFKLILHNQARMFVASATAFFLGMTINSTVISIIKSRQRRRGISLKKEFITTVWTRIATSSAFGIIIDVSLFSLVAFYGIVPADKLANVILFEDAYKISYEIVLAPVSILLIYFLKVKEKVDIYDELSNLNPFRIDTNYKISANKFDENYYKSKRNNDG
ncbi:VUT family protein [Legionella nagasakiensis]|uniref:VUT family protein n=1 Tax=Legionella nagasakiensis TaxID=535290 RepID=UPI001F5F0652|nr:VUT family protein [Legionella nagasakiensis]